MADNTDKIQIKITTDADLGGLDKAKEKAAGATGAVENLSKSTKGFSSAMSAVNQALAGFGVLTLITKIGEVIKAIQDAKKAHEDLVANIGADNAAVAVKRLRDEYNNLKTAIAQANTEIDRTRQNSDDLTAAQRRLADATLAAQEESAVAADPERESIIRAQYGERRAATAAQRSAADSAQDEQRIDDDIRRKEAEIAQREERIKEFMASGQEYSGRAAQAQERSVAEANRRGASGLRGRGFLGKQFESIERYAGYASGFMSQAGAAFESAKSLQQEQQVDQAALEGLRQRRPVLQARTAATQAESSLATDQAARQTSVAETRAAREAEKKQIQEQIEARKLLMQQDKEMYEQRQREAKGHASTESREAQEHASAAEFMRSSGSKRGYAAALQAYQQEQSEADAAQAALLAVGQEAVATMRRHKQELDTLKEQLSRIGQ